MNIPEDFKRNLEEYLSDLERRVSIEKDTLELINDIPENLDNTVRIKESIIRTIEAYNNAKEHLLKYFPELIK